jgi:hypothetical protein
MPKGGNNSKIYLLFTINFSFILQNFLIVKYLDNCVNCCASWTKMWDREKLCLVNNLATLYLYDENVHLYTL